MLGGDLRYIFYLYPAIKGAFGINDNHGAQLAQSKTTGTDNLNLFLQASSLNLLIKFLDDLCGSGRGTARTTADQHMGAIKIHVDFLLNKPK